MIAAVAIGGYVLYKVYQAAQVTKTAAGAIGSAASQFTPAALASSIAGDASAAAGSVSDLFTGGNMESQQQVAVDQADGDPTLAAFFDGANSPYSYDPNGAYFGSSN